MTIKTEKTLDNFILFFIIIFLGSLTNSIFVNQLGYYGALILILTKNYFTKENNFVKTGLEFPILLFIIAEILSTIFSVNQPQAFHNLLKRLLLLPIIYFVTAGSKSQNDNKLFFKVFIGAATLSTGYYLITAYSYFVNNIYQLTHSGPDSLQFPITTSEILSFVTVLLFAFILTNKTNWKIKLLQIILFIISLSGLLATYKRTGWIGAAAGIFVILALNKNWKTVIGLSICGLLLLFSAKNSNEIYVYTKSNLQLENSFQSDGRAYSSYSENGNIFIPNFEEGVKKIEKEKLISIKKFEAPLREIKKWNDSLYIAFLSDTRFLILDEIAQNSKILSEIISPGYTKESLIFNDKLYILDNDSGLTIVNNSFEMERFTVEKLTEHFEIDSSKIIFYSPTFLEIYNLDKKNISQKFWEYNSKNKIHSATLFNDYLFISTDDSLITFKINTNKISNRIASKNNFVTKFIKSDEILYGVESSGDLNKFVFKNNEIEKINLLNFGFLPTDVNITDKNIIATKVKRSRLLSIFDLHNQSNFTRFAFWKAGIKIWKDNPIFGVGDIDLAKLYVKYKNNYDKEIQGHMHNNYVHVLVILGGFGFCVFVFLFVKILIINFNIYLEVKEIDFLSSYAIGSIGVVCSFLVSGLTEWNFGDHEIITLLWFIIGLNFSLYNKSKDKI